MKKILSLILTLTALLGCCASAMENETVECYAFDPSAVTKLGFETLKMLSDGTENQIISPASLAFALAMAAEGAQGETKQEILCALGASAASDVGGLQGVLEEVGQKVANAAFIAGALELRDEYGRALHESFDAELFENDGDTVEKLNAWVAEKTDGMIEKMIDGELSEDVRLILVNAIAMDARWAAPFAKEATCEDIFHTSDGEVTVDFMHQRGYREYGERDGVQLLKLRYRNELENGRSDLCMLIALPEEGGVPAVLDGLCAEGLGYFTFDEEYREVILSMPKVDLSVSNTLSDALKAQGIEKAFSDDADFSGMTDGDRLLIDSVVQNTRLIMDEEGTKAAAATMVVMADMAMPTCEPVEFNMNRPFVLVIADEASGNVCFAGAIANPASN